MKSELQSRIKDVDKLLNKLLSATDNPQRKIYDAMRYSIFAGGKRLRPILMREVACMCGGSWNDVAYFACAMEMIHTYSLIHDDLPAMDNDSLRRGKPTNHIKFGEDIAILAGDALLNKAFEIASAPNACSDIATQLKAIAVLAKSSGTEGMVGGQVVDLESENRKISLDELKYIHLLKTGAIIRASCIIGGMLGGADEEQLTSIDAFACNLGVAFQIRDDILDITGNEEQLGKPIGSDVECGKNTYVSICGIDTSIGLVKEFSENAKKALRRFGEKADFLIRLTDYLIERNN